jgi:hypothetical protein
MKTTYIPILGAIVIMVIGFRLEVSCLLRWDSLSVDRKQNMLFWGSALFGFGLGVGVEHLVPLILSWP